MAFHVYISVQIHFLTYLALWICFSDTECQIICVDIDFTDNMLAAVAYAAIGVCSCHNCHWPPQHTDTDRLLNKWAYAQSENCWGFGIGSREDSSGGGAWNLTSPTAAVHSVQRTAEERKSSSSLSSAVHYKGLGEQQFLSVVLLH